MFCMDFIHADEQKADILFYIIAALVAECVFDVYNLSLSLTF